MEETMNKKEEAYEKKMKELEEKLSIQMAATTQAIAAIVENRFKVIDGINTEISELQRSLGIAHKDTTDLKNDIKAVNGGNKALNKAISTLEERAADAEDRGRRHNIRFYNIPEQEQGIEDCKAKIRNLVLPLLDTDKVWLDRAHRLGKYDQKKTRPIIV